MLSGIIIAGLVLAAAATGGIFKPGEWYDGLNKPWWTPPGWAFPVVWTILYCMIAYAGWLPVVWTILYCMIAYAGWLVWGVSATLSMLMLCFYGP